MFEKTKNWISDKWRRFKKWIVVGVLGIGVVIAASSVPTDDPVLNAPKEKILSHKVIKDIRIEEVSTATSTKKEVIDYGDIIEYKYLSCRLSKFGAEEQLFFSGTSLGTERPQEYCTRIRNLV
ncbi:hypothetical protein LCGC14_1415980 [marine sediment metagenome]|uniref:Uncharacterized protein n=1 Tax=marine sediment metagenome TaxID=412755 RepID=A0A0F9KE08_9ZZZZ